MLGDGEAAARPAGTSRRARARPHSRPRPRTRRILRGIALGAAALLVLGIGAVGVQLARLPADDVAPIAVGALEVAAPFEGESGAAALQVSGDAVRVLRDGALVWASEPGRAFLTAATGTLDVQEHRGYFWPAVHRDRVWSEQTIDAVTPTAEGWTLEGRLRAGAHETPYELAIVDDGARVTMAASVPAATSVALHSGRTERAGVHGFGEQFTDFDLDGRVIPLLVREQGVGRGLQPLSLLADLTNHAAGGTDLMTYAAWPSFATDDLRGLRVAPGSAAAHAFAVADLSAPGRVGVEVWNPSVTVELAGGDTPAAVVAALHEGDERRPIADWTQHGMLVGAQGGSDAVRERVAALREAGTEIAGVWLQDWVGQRTTDFGERLWWTWQLDRTRYPDWQRLVDELHAEGTRVTSYVNPFLVDAAPKGDPGIRNLYAEARDAQLLVRDASGQPYGIDQGGFTAYLVDLTNPAARDWFAEVIAEEVLGEGVDGFMADFAEGLPFDAALHEGSAAELHNAWPRLWMETVADACRRAGEPECVTWFRAGSLGATPALAWTGDQLVDFGREDGLESALLGTLSAGVSGWPVVHSDLGGYTSIDARVHDYVRSPELLQRWAELAAFGPMMRTHETNRPAANLQPDEDAAVASHLAAMTRVFAALAGYRAEVLDEAVRTGLPVMRHGWLVAPGTAAAEVDTQFFLGDDVLVAPVLRPGADEVAVTLPPGQWRHLFTGELVEGGQTVTVPAPIGQPAAYVDAASPWADELVDAVRGSG
ncbi:alpha-glucosidase [Agrococcus baldri]|uniref:Alpha-glucosidase n=1 Tax=Agrococcus baldri TaxID=153730 RepID=A0AA87RAV2_9MICO|nr:alpha-glucosidase [Agrococcus baldri]GEK79670.1 alpha-glucosidase [Agrococcus baldri]